MKRALVVVVVGIAVVAGIVAVGPQLAAARTQAAAAPLRTVRVERGELVTTVNAAGNIAARALTSLSFRTLGQVKAVTVELGQVVAEGEVLMELDGTDVELDVAKARLSLATAENQLAKARAGATESELAAAQAGLASAQENLAKVQAGPTREQMAATEATLASARQRYQQLQSGPSDDELATARAGLEKATVALQQAQVNYADKSDDPNQSGAAEEAYRRALLDLEVAQANYNLATKGASSADLQNALAQVRQAEDSLQRLRTSPTEAELAAAQSQVAQAQSQVDRLLSGSTTQDLAIAETQVEQARLTLQQAERRLQDTRLVAPFGGTVTDIGYRAGEYVTANAPAVSLADLSAFELEVPVAEVDVTRVRAGQPVEVGLESQREVRLRGVVAYVNPVAQVTQGVVSYRVTIEISEPDAALRSGMTAEARIVVEERQGVLLVPTRAVRPEGSGYVAEVLRDGQVVTVPVRLGAASETMSEVLEGLSEGDEVVVRAVDNATGGQPTFFGMPGGRPRSG